MILSGRDFTTKLDSRGRRSKLNRCCLEDPLNSSSFLRYARRMKRFSAGEVNPLLERSFSMESVMWSSGVSEVASVEEERCLVLL